MHTLQAGGCLIDDQCLADGAADPQNSCRECLSSASQTSWINDDSNVCADGDPCTEQDRCAMGVCQPGTRLARRAAPAATAEWTAAATRSSSREAAPAGPAQTRPASSQRWSGWASFSSGSGGSADRRKTGCPPARTKRSDMAKTKKMSACKGPDAAVVELGDARKGIDLEAYQEYVRLCAAGAPAALVQVIGHRGSAPAQGWARP